MQVGSEGGGQSQDFDLNLAPIIDCFTVLITFMLASASFLAVGVFDSGAAADGAAATDQKPAAIRVDAELTPKKEIVLRVEGRTKFTKSLAAKDGDWNFPALVAEVSELRRNWPDTQGMILNADNEVQYGEVVRAMEALKTHIPAVLLRGL